MEINNKEGGKMAFRFKRTIKILPGVKLNLNKDSVGLSVGPRGAKVTVNSKGGLRQTVGLPGTGLSVTSYDNLLESETDNSVQQPIDGNATTPEFVSFKCTNCGKDLSVGSTWSSASCPYCNTTFVINQNSINQCISDNTVYIRAVSVNTFFADNDVEVRSDKMFLINTRTGRVKKEYYFNKMENIRIDNDCLVFDYTDNKLPIVLTFKDNKTTEICNFIINAKQGIYYN